MLNKLNHWFFLSCIISAITFAGCNCGDTAPDHKVVSPSESLVEAESPVSIHGASFSLVTVTLLDEEGEPVPGIEVEIFGSREGHDIIMQPASPSNSDGVVTGRLSSTVTGTTVISVVAGEVELEATAEIEFIDEEECPDGQIYCGEETGCVTIGSLEHCGTCNDACDEPDNAEAFCNGSCGWSCLEGYENCDDDPETGCETELGTVDNCLECNDQCPKPANSDAVCTDEGCTFICHEGMGSCDGDLSTGCETELLEGECPPRECPPGEVDCGAAGCVELGTEDHCLECHDQCHAPDNATAVCMDTGCSFACLEGYANCDRDPSTGCESELDEDGLCPSGCYPGELDCGDGCVSLDTTDNCGACGVTCTAPDNSTAICTLAGCSFECLSGFDNCDGNDETGCEQPLDVPEHCGWCDNECPNPPNAIGICSDPDTGECEYQCVEGFADCNNDIEDGCETDLSINTCCDFESFIEISAPCLVLEESGLAVVHVEVRDEMQQKISGAEVTIDMGGLVVVEEIVESISRPGIYWAVVEAPDQAGEYEISATATYDGDWSCGAMITIPPQTVEVISETIYDAGGTGGCIPRGGNLAVRVLDKAGDPVEGAFVMAGQSASLSLFSNYEAFLGGSSGDIANNILTDEEGYARFTDMGSLIRNSSVMITAGAEGYAYTSLAGFDTSKMVIVLEELPPPPPVDRVKLSGTVEPEYHTNNTGRVGLSLVTQNLDMHILSRFDFMDLLEPDRDVWVDGPLSMSLSIPANIHLPYQTHMGLHMLAVPPDWSINPKRHSELDLPVLQGEVTIEDAILNQDDMPALLSAINFEKVGIQRQLPTDIDRPDIAIELTGELSATMPVEAINAPQGELYIFSFGDVDGLYGNGSIFLQGVSVMDNYTELSGLLTTVEEQGQFADTHHLAMSLSMVHGGGASAVINRSITDRNSPRVLDDFFDVPATASVSGRSFSWPDVTNPNSPPHYHVARSLLLRVTRSSGRLEEEPFWYIFSPAGTDSFTLPTLPLHAPRADTQGYLTTTGSFQVNRWFLGLFHLGLNPEPSALEDGRIIFNEIEDHMTHMSISRNNL